MIVGIGLDIIELQRIEQALNRTRGFAQKILTDKEYAIFETLVPHRQIEFLAGRFAAKEACSKALGTGIGQLHFHDMEILPDGNNKPIMTCTKYNGAIFVSITHTKTVAGAQVILEE